MMIKAVACSVCTLNSRQYYLTVQATALNKGYGSKELSFQMIGRHQPRLMKPGSVFWYYDNEVEMLDKMGKIDRKIQRNLKPPHQIEGIETKPDIQSIQAFMWNKKVYPGIVYNTKLPLSDSLAIEKECSKLDGVFATYFKNWERDTIFVEIVHQEDLWTKPTRNIMKKRKLDKGLLFN